MSLNKDVTIRVYAVLTNGKNEVLLLNETYKGLNFTKFPGGGMEWGEGTLDTIKRELREELKLENVPLAHFYTTDFFVESYFDTSTQVISIYYKNTTPINEADIVFDQNDLHLLSYKWQPLSSLRTDHVTFPIDKKVVAILLAQGAK